MEPDTDPGLTLYTRDGRRKYVTPSERRAFIDMAEVEGRCLLGTFALVLAYTGCRISEALALTPSNVEAVEGFVSIRTLKKRGKLVVREVPVPPELITRLLSATTGMAAADIVFPWSRGHAWVLIKELLRRSGCPSGPHATPKGLRHGFAVNAAQSGVPITFIRRWLGHSRLSTTAIYLEAIGSEERDIASRMWSRPRPGTKSPSAEPPMDLTAGAKIVWLLIGLSS